MICQMASLMVNVADIEKVLESERGMTATDIAKQLAVDRREVSRILHGEQSRFTQGEDGIWRLMPRQKSHEVVRRPGPFGPARDLLPKDQQLEVVSADTPCYVALDRMISLGYSVVPVRDGSGHIIGVFSLAAFTERVNGVADSNISVRSICDQSVEDCMTLPQFLDPDRYIDTTVDWSNVDYVIVGSQEEPVGILTITDVWAKLNDFAEAYVLINEIEADVRTLIAFVANVRLTDWINDLKMPPHASRPQSLEEFTFSQYSLLMCEKKVRWPCFEPVLAQPRDLFISEFERINKLRNEFMHFKVSSSVARCNQLRAFRDRTRAAISRASRTNVED